MKRAKKHSVQTIPAKNIRIDGGVLKFTVELISGDKFHVIYGKDPLPFYAKDQRVYPAKTKPNGEILVKGYRETFEYFITYPDSHNTLQEWYEDAYEDVFLAYQKAKEDHSSYGELPA